jgi:hypothetical protein
VPWPISANSGVRLAPFRWREHLTPYWIIIGSSQRFVAKLASSSCGRTRAMRLRFIARGKRSWDLGLRSREQVAQRFYLPDVPWTRLAFDHACDDVFTGLTENPQDISMRCPRIVIERLDPPITPAADLAGRTQDDRFEQLSRVHCLHRPDQTMSTISVTQSAFTPLSFARQQALYRAELGEWMISEKPKLCTVERHVLPPHFEKRTCPVTVFGGVTTERRFEKLVNSKTPNALFSSNLRAKIVSRAKHVS